MQIEEKPTVHFENIPDDLAEIDHWILWAFEEKRTKDNEIAIDENGEIQYTKIPKQPNGKNADSTNATTWNALETVEEALNNFPDQFDGVGFVFTNSGIVGIDIDNRSEELNGYLSNDEVDLTTNAVAEMIETTKSYAEISPSGNGIHIYMKGTKPAGKSKTGDFEMYDTKRFFTVTGNRISDRKQLADDEELNVLHYLHKKYIGTSDTRDFESDIQDIMDTANTSSLSDKEVIQKIMASKQKAKFMRLFNQGDTSDYGNDDSSADYALIGILRWWTNNDIEQMDRLFRESALMRDKWDRPTGKSTYGINTMIQNITESDGDGYQADAPKKYEFNMKGNTQNTYSYDDTGNAERFYDQHGDEFLFNTTTNKWHIYDGKVWKEDDTKEAYKRATDVAYALKNEPVRVAPGVDKEQAIKMLEDHIKKTRSHQWKTNMLKGASSLLAISANHFDQAGNILNLANGYYDLDHDKFREHDRSLYLTKLTDIEYDPEATSPLWNQFINETFLGDMELINYVQRAVGYSLSNKVNERQLYFLLGDGDNGKTVFINVLEALMGSYSKNINPEALMVNKNKDADSASPTLAKLKGARFVSTGESKESGQLDESLVKRLTGGDTITARFLNQNEFSYSPEFKIWLATNFKPIIKNNDPAIWNRIVLIPFLNKVTGNQINNELTNELKQELPGILNWALEGYRQYTQWGLKNTEPTVIKEQRESYQKEMDLTGEFINQVCVVGDQYEISSSTLWKAFKRWAEDIGENPGSNRELSQDLEKKGFIKKKRSEGMIFLGINITDK